MQRADFSIAEHVADLIDIADSHRKKALHPVLGRCVEITDLLFFELDLHHFNMQVHRCGKAKRGTIDLENISLSKKAACLVQHVGAVAQEMQLHTRETYSPVRVSILILSPSSIKRGTWTLAPLSVTAGFKTRPEVSPRRPVVVSTIFISRNVGGTTSMGCPL